MSNTKKKILVGMSGGVDSSAAALILRDQGHEVAGLTFELWDSEDGTCGTKNDVRDAAEVCRVLGIPHFVVDFRKEFRQQVMERFVQDYRHGLTPNPCVDCNRTIKFAAFADKAKELGYDYIATGHYGRVLPVFIQIGHSIHHRRFSILRFLQAAFLICPQDIHAHPLRRCQKCGDQPIVLIVIYPKIIFHFFQRHQHPACPPSLPAAPHVRGHRPIFYIQHIRHWPSAPAPSPPRTVPASRPPSGSQGSPPGRWRHTVRSSA